MGVRTINRMLLDNLHHADHSGGLAIGVIEESLISLLHVSHQIACCVVVSCIFQAIESLWPLPTGLRTPIDPSLAHDTQSTMLKRREKLTIPGLWLLGGSQIINGELDVHALFQARVWLRLHQPVRMASILLGHVRWGRVRLRLRDASFPISSRQTLARSPTAVLFLRGRC